MSSLLFLLLVPGPPGHQRSAVRDRLADMLAILLALAYGALMVPLGVATKPGAAIPWPVDVTIGVLCAAALLVRRRWPIPVCLALLPFGAISVMATGPILIALFTVAIRYRPRALLPLATVHVLTGCVYFFLQHESPMPLWVDIVMRAVTGLAAIGWGLFMQAYRELTRSLRRQTERLEAEQQLRVEQARLTERESIAREMHDVLAHRLSMISLHAGALEVRTDADPAELAGAARTIRFSAHEGLQELREVIGVLRHVDDGPPEPPQPSFADLADLVERARTAGMRIDYTCRVPPAGPSRLGRTAYRLVQEGLTNAQKHAPGSDVEVLLDRADGLDLRILVTNPLPVHLTGGHDTGKHNPGKHDAGKHNPDGYNPGKHNPSGHDPGKHNPGGHAPGGHEPGGHEPGGHEPGGHEPGENNPGGNNPGGNGAGLIGVGERVALAGGRVEYGPRQGHFRLEAWLPWPK